MINVKDMNIKDYSVMPQKILQFGEGNFLRAFFDFMVQKLNENNMLSGSVVMVKPTSSKPRPEFNEQNCRYFVLERGLENGNIIDRSTPITSVSRFLSAYEDAQELLNIAASPELSVIVSNTTEAGIVYNEGESFDEYPNVSYPAKLCRLLFARYSSLGRDFSPLILPVELIENNGSVLKDIVIRYADDWNLGADFISYLRDDCKFCSTLVDRIVTGFPQNDTQSVFAKLGCEDKLAVACEPYISWVIEGREDWKDIFPAHKIFENVKWVDDISSYRERKVKILNGAHAMSVLAAYLCGYSIVRDMMHDDDFSYYLNTAIDKEIIPTINMEKAELQNFKNSVFERFCNPFIDHKLLDISLNSVSKFRARCLGSILQYTDIFGTAPDLLSFAFAALIKFYDGKFVPNGDFVAKSDYSEYFVRDSEDVLRRFEYAYKTDDPVYEILRNENMWGTDLTCISSLYSKVADCFDNIKKFGVRQSLRKVLYHE